MTCRFITDIHKSLNERDLLDLESDAAKEFLEMLYKPFIVDDHPSMEENQNIIRIELENDKSQQPLIQISISNDGGET